MDFREQMKWRDAVTDAMSDTGYVEFPSTIWGNKESTIYLSGRFSMANLRYIIDAWAKLPPGAMGEE